MCTVHEIMFMNLNDYSHELPPISRSVPIYRLNRDFCSPQSRILFLDTIAQVRKNENRRKNFAILIDFSEEKMKELVEFSKALVEMPLAASPQPIISR